MARVFLPPHYVSNDYYMVEGWRQDDRHIRAAWDGALEIHIRWSEPGEQDSLDRAAEIGHKRGVDRLVSWRKASDAVRNITHGLRCNYDQAATFGFQSEVMSGKHNIVLPHSMTASEKTARTIATAGMIASFASPHLANASANKVRLGTALSADRPEAAACLAVADALRLGASSSRTRASFEAILKGDPVPHKDEWRLEHKGIAAVAPGFDWFHVGPIVVACTETDAYIFSSTTRYFVAETLWTCGGWILAGLNHNNQHAATAARIGFDYIRDNLCTLLKTSSGPWRLARQMKTSYAITLAMHDYKNATKDERELIDVQVRGLKEEVETYRSGEVPWYEVVARMDETIQADLGTAWNMLPPPDCDMSAVNSGIKKKLNAQRKFDEAAWSDFVSYSRHAVLSHMLFARPDTEVDWHGEDEPKWAEKCREKVLTYADTYVNFTCKLPWDRHLETWGYTTQDVTHMNADKSLYDTPEACRSTTDGGMSELRYYVEHGHMFSGRWSAQEVRSSWEKGAPVGDRMGYVAAKSENTKPAGQQRETLSADDVLRECLTELDINVSKLSKFVNGVVVRAGKVQTERMIHNVMSKMHEGGLMLSLDVSGWSPNMVRKGEMMFADMLMGFFDIPEAQRASTLFTALNVIVARGGLHDSWQAEDGSFQGFFGAVDTMLHSMMCQWAFHEEKKAGRIARTAKVDKATVMDDILAAITGIKVKPADALESFIHQYKRLGFTADAVKTLARGKVGHFLNRLYADGAEVLTPFKIAAKADREWDRVWVTLHDEIDAVFNSYCGASDRGYKSHAAYTMACWRSLWRMWERNKDIAAEGARFEFLFAWLPRSLGGAGFPVYGAWVNKLGASSLDNAMSAIYTIRDLMKQMGSHTSVALAETLNTVLTELAFVKLSQRSAVAVMDDPLSVHADGVPDAAAVRRSVAESALSRIKVHDELAALMSISRTAEYDSCVKSFLTSAEWSADVVSEIAATLPHAVTGVLLERLSSCDKLLRSAPHHVRNRAWKEFLRVNKRAATSWVYLKFTGRDESIDDAVTFCRVLRGRMFDAAGFRLANAEAPGSLSLLGRSQSEHETTIWVKAPATTDIDRTPAGCVPTIMRSYKAASARGRVSRGARDLGPLGSAFARICAVSSLGHSNGMNASAVDQLWNTLWTGSPHTIAIPKHAVPCSNTNRVCSRFTVTTHTVAAMPNYCPHISVDAHRAIHLLEPIPRTFSWLSVIYTLKAAAALDVELGERDGFQRGYAVRHIAASGRAEPEWPAQWEAPNVQCVASLARAMTAVAQEWSMDPDVDEPEGEDDPLIIAAAAVEKSRRSALDRLATFSGAGVFGIMDAGLFQQPQQHSGEADVRGHASTRTGQTTEPEEGAYRAVVQAAVKVFARSDAREAAAEARRVWARMFHGQKPEDFENRWSWVKGLLSENEDRFLRAMKPARHLFDPVDPRASRAERYYRYASQHLDKEKDTSRDPWARYYHHFMAAICNQLALPHVTSYAAACGSLVRAMATGCDTVTMRRMSGPDTSADEEMRAIQAPNTVQRACQSMVNACLPPDWSDHDEVYRGALYAVRRAMVYMAVDFAVPEIQLAQAPIPLSQEFDLMDRVGPVRMDAGPRGANAGPTDEQVRAFLLENGMFMSVQDARVTMMDDIKQWLEGEDDAGNADV